MVSGETSEFNLVFQDPFHAKEGPSLKVTFSAMSVRKNQSRFDCRSIKKYYCEIWIDF